jgi:predicted small lipoprotein YifL
MQKLLVVPLMLLGFVLLTGCGKKTPDPMPNDNVQLPNNDLVVDAVRVEGEELETTGAVGSPIDPALLEEVVDIDMYPGAITTGELTF